MFYWCTAVFGVLFGLAGLAALGDPGSGGGLGGLITMALAGGLFAALGVCAARSRVELGEGHIACFNAFRAYRLARSDIRSIQVVDDWNYYGMPVDGLVVHTARTHNDWPSLRFGKPQYMLTPLRRIHTRRGLDILAAQRDLISAWLGHDPDQ